MAGTMTIKVPALSRDEVRAMDRAAKACSPPVSRSAWARHVLIGACGPKPAQSVPVPEIQAPAPVLGPVKPGIPRLRDVLDAMDRRSSIPTKCALCGGVNGSHDPDCGGSETPA